MVEERGIKRRARNVGKEEKMGQKSEEIILTKIFSTVVTFLANFEGLYPAENGAGRQGWAEAWRKGWNRTS